MICSSAAHRVPEGPQRPTRAIQEDRHDVAALMLGKPATEADILNRWSNPAERLKTAASASLLFAAAFLVIYALARLLEAVFERFQRKRR